jgi:hypothetical protein
VRFLEFCGWEPAYTASAFPNPVVLNPIGNSDPVKKAWQLWLGWPGVPVESACTDPTGSSAYMLIKRAMRIVRFMAVLLF